MTLKSFGTITPSSNIIVERVTLAMTRDLDGVSPHFARFGHSGRTDRAKNDYDWEAMLGAAGLLADAKLDLICWNGTMGGMVGLDRDELLCEHITERFGIPAVTSSLALAQLLRANRLRRIGFVTPYDAAANAAIVRHWTRGGFECLPPVGAGLSDNFSYSTLEPAQLSKMARVAAQATPDLLIFYCTNMNGAGLCVPLEQELGLPVLDSVSAGVFSALRGIGITQDFSARWGRLLR